MKPEAELKLLSLIYQFRDRALKSANIKEKDVGEKNRLILELGFHDDDGHVSTMVLVLDKELTLCDCEELYENVVGS
jgi:hypothetical protein